MTQLFGKEIQDYVLETAFEYQQNDIHYFKINDIDYQSKVRNIDNGNIVNNILDSFHKF